MVNLSEYRASLKRLIEADNVDDAFVIEGIDSKTAAIVKSSKSFRASRSASQSTQDVPATPCGGMSQRQKH